MADQKLVLMVARRDFHEHPCKSLALLDRRL